MADNSAVTWIATIDSNSDRGMKFAMYATAMMNDSGTITRSR